MTTAFRFLLPPTQPVPPRPLARSFSLIQQANLTRFSPAWPMAMTLRSFSPYLALKMLDRVVDALAPHFRGVEEFDHAVMHVGIGRFRGFALEDQGHRSPPSAGGPPTSRRDGYR